MRIISSFQCTRKRSKAAQFLFFFRSVLHMHSKRSSIHNHTLHPILKKGEGDIQIELFECTYTLLDNKSSTSDSLSFLFLLPFG